MPEPGDEGQRGEQRRAYRENAFLVALLLFLAIGSAWNYRDSLLKLLPTETRRALNALTQSPSPSPAASRLPGPSDPPPGTPVPIATLPAFDLRRYASLDPASEAADELLCDYARDAVDGSGSRVLTYPEPLRYLWGMCSVEFHVLGEGFNGYFFTGRAEGLRFAREGYARLGLPVLAEVMAHADKRYLTALDRFDQAHREVAGSHSENEAWEAFSSAGQDLGIDELDALWDHAFQPEEVHRRRHAYVLDQSRHFLPEQAALR